MITGRRPRFSMGHSAPHTPSPPDAPGDPDRLAPEAVRRLFVEHNRALVSFLRTRVRSDQEAREVAQEAYVRLLQLEQPAAISFLRAYLYRTALNIAVDRARSEGVRDAAHRDPVFDDSGFEPNPERGAEARQQLDLIRAAVAEMPARPRLAFLWHRFAEMSPPEIAERLGVGERMVRNYIAQALVHVRLRLDEHNRAGDPAGQEADHG
jgi:RNA polymerase sigma-70 factor (ECF subfamily)